MLVDNLEQLLGFMEALGQSPPVREIRVVEITRPNQVDDEQRLIISKDALQTPATYAARFELITHSGLAWVNMSCCGVHNGFLIISIELQDRALVTNSSKPTSVNYSWLSSSQIEQYGWDVTPRLVIM